MATFGKHLTGRILLPAVLYCLVSRVTCQEWRNTTAILKQEEQCKMYTMKCDGNQHIVLGAMSYLHPVDQSSSLGAQTPIRQCPAVTTENTCCLDEPPSCWESYSRDGLYSVYQICSGRQECNGIAEEQKPENCKVNDNGDEQSPAVLFKYYCVDEKYIVDLCAVDSGYFSGQNQMFRFDGSVSLRRISTECTCKIEVSDADSKVNVTAIDIRLHQHGNRETCSSAALETENLKMKCNLDKDGIFNRQYENKGGFTVSLSNLLMTGDKDVPAMVWFLVTVSTSTEAKYSCHTVLDQWVSDVLNFSSEYVQQDGWEAKEIIGEPDRYPDYGDETGTWAQIISDSNDAKEYIEVQFQHFVLLLSIHIYETYHAGGVTAIKARPQGGTWQTLWSTNKPEVIKKSRIFSPNLATHSFLTREIRIEVDCTVGGSSKYVEIDAVKITGRLESFVSLVDKGQNIQAQKHRCQRQYQLHLPHHQSCHQF